jgi:predicted outer membrane repeat protein
VSQTITDELSRRGILCIIGQGSSRSDVVTRVNVARNAAAFIVGSTLGIKGLEIEGVEGVVRTNRAISLVSSEASVDLQNVSVRKLNSTNLFGGVVDIVAGSLVAVDVTFENNAAINGGVLYCGQSLGQARATFTRVSSTVHNQHGLKPLPLDGHNVRHQLVALLAAAVHSAESAWQGQQEAEAQP